MSCVEDAVIKDGYISYYDYLDEYEGDGTDYGDDYEPVVLEINELQEFVSQNASSFDSGDFWGFITITGGQITYMMIEYMP